VKKLLPIQLFFINAYWLGLSFMWNSLHPIILPAVLLHLVPEDAKNSYLGILTFVGLLLAMLVQPISGALSDRWRSPWGKRRPLALLGTGLDLVFLILLARSGSLTMLIIGYIGLQIASNIAHGPLQGLIPDLVPPAQLGTASAYKNMLDMAGLIAASLAAGNLLAPQDRYPTRIMLVVMAVLIFSALLTFAKAREEPSLLEGHQRTRNGRMPLAEIFHVDIRLHTDYFWLILSRFVFLLGIYGVQTFAQYYVRDVMQAANPIKATGDLMAALALALLACALLGGWLADRIGSRRVITLASLVSALGCLLLLMARDLTSLTLFAGVLGAGIGLYLTSNWALASRLAPAGQAGKFLGLTNLATAGASAFSKILGVPIDFLNHTQPGAYWGYSGLFLLGGVSALLSLLFLARVKDPH